MSFGFFCPYGLIRDRGKCFRYKQIAVRDIKIDFRYTIFVLRDSRINFRDILLPFRDMGLDFRDMHILFFVVTEGLPYVAEADSYVAEACNTLN